MTIIDLPLVIRKMKIEFYTRFGIVSIKIKIVNNFLKKCYQSINYFISLYLKQGIRNIPPFKTTLSHL